ncbi:ABC transporter ATP-binding protein [Magnetospirillum gryphiswaldense]|uniref:ABC transporter, ATP-binding protein n=1 Tax=Magnetospirillum gryphiswaldense TaxID=55518 RepID=A4U4L7_9PROT|nr:ABC transporter ATP-binding protein [Magnetospirillum gryphiswaldense]AVM72651.1 Bicarbonate transport ATP-binding protein CmpD [Magnetospirillum gryphiswaldense MSR-1]AVM76554.1 Bicarbonate transport ATP-binding protein CmpD [Magnetospirillum gryphiswaldense]CAM77824.1 ABC transporter, ATP-binding protein [Magnetospirillum gryphiswaldense MSR-1]
MSRVSIDNLWMEYGDQVVLERICLDIPSGEFCAMVGPSGCGKTTLLRLLLSMEQPTRGSIRIDGQPLAAEPGPDRGVVFQRYSAYAHLTVQENVVLGLEFARAPLFGKLWGAKKRQALDEVRHVIDAVGLDQARDKYPGELSGGMQQRLSIAQALVRKPRILLMDEPFGALDPGTKAQMHDLVRALWRAERMTVFMVTHDIKEGFGLSTRVLAFDKVRHDPDAPQAYGATITLNLPLDDKPERAEIVQV